jgi:hypothetical protein
MTEDAKVTLWNEPWSPLSIPRSGPPRARRAGNGDLVIANVGICDVRFFGDGSAVRTTSGSDRPTVITHFPPDAQQGEDQ